MAQDLMHSFIDCSFLLYILSLLNELIHVIIMIFVGCQLVPTMRRHCTLPHFALSHTSPCAMSQNSVTETSLLY